MSSAIMENQHPARNELELRRELEPRRQQESPRKSVAYLVFVGFDLRDERSSGGVHLTRRNVSLESATPSSRVRRHRRRGGR